MASDLKFEIIEDFGAFGEGKWQKHLTLIKWGGNNPKYDIRPWNDDMTKCGKGVTLDLEDLMDLQDMFSKIIDGDDNEVEDVDDYEYYDEV